MKSKNQTTKITKNIQGFSHVKNVRQIPVVKMEENVRVKYLVTDKKLIAPFFVVLLSLLFSVGIFQVLTPTVFAADGINRRINFQGKVVNKVGETNVTNGSYSFTFRFFDAASGGTQLPSGSPWSETKSLTVTDGIFRTALGDTTPIPSTLNFNSDSIYLEMVFNGETFTSRIRMTAVAYAFNAEKVNGLTVTNTSDNPFSSATTLKIADGKTIVLNNSLTLSGADSKTWNFGSNDLSFTTSANTSLTLPTTGTLLTNTASANQTITSTQTSGTVFGVTDSTNISAAIKGAVITLSGTGAFDQTGLEFNLSGASGTNLNDIVGSGSTWRVSRAGAAVFASIGATSPGTGAFTTLSSTGATTLGDQETDTITLTGSVNSNLNFLDANTTSYTIAGADASTATGAAGDLTVRAGSGGATSGNGGNIILSGGTVTSGTAGYIALQTAGTERLRVAADGTFLFEKGANDLTFSVTAPSGASRILTVPALGADGNVAAYGGALAAGDLLYGATTNVLTRLTIGSNGNCLTVASSLPAWGSCSGAATTWNSIAVPTGNLTLAMDADTTTFDWSTLTTTNAFTMTANGLTTGNLLSLTSTSNVFTSGQLLRLDHTATYTSAQTVSGNLIDLNKSLTMNLAANTMTASGVSAIIAETYTASAGTINVTGNALAITRGGSATTAITTTLNISGALASFTDNALTGSGTLTHSGDVVAIAQNYSAATGSALDVTSAGTGVAARITTSGGGGGLVVNHTGSAGNILDIQDNSSTMLAVDINGKVLINSGTQTVFPQFFARTNAPNLAANGDFAIGKSAATNGTTSGRIWIRAANLNYRFQSAASTADYSEYLEQEDTSEPGDVMVLSDSNKQSVKRSSKAYDQKVLGVVSVYGTSNNNLYCWDESCDRSKDPKYANVGMLGQVYTKISTENGEIRPGDPLTTSSVQGVAMKATKTGRIVGYALDFFDGTKSGEDLWLNVDEKKPDVYPVRDDIADPPGDPPPKQVKIGKIVILLQAGWYDPAAPPPDIGSVAVEREETGLSYAVKDTGTGLVSENEIVAKKTVFGSVKAGIIIAKEMETEGLIVSGKSKLKEIETNIIDIATDSAQLVIRGDGSETVFSIDREGNAYFKGTLTADKISGLAVLESGIRNQESRIKNLEDLFASGSASVSTATPSVATDSTSDIQSSASAIFDEIDSLTQKQERESLVLSGLTVDGIATVSADFRVKGNGLIEGVLSIIDTLITNNLIVSKVADFFDRVVFHGNVAFRGTPIFNKDTAGYATIKKDSKKTEVRFEGEYPETPVINATLVATKLNDESFIRYKADGLCDSSETIESCQEKIDQLLLSQTTRFVVTDRSRKGFAIVVENNAQVDMEFSWNAFAVDNGLAIQARDGPE